MSIELFTPTDPQLIAGTGPYPIGHPYQQQSDIIVTVSLAGTDTILPLADYSLTPLAATINGNLTLSSAAATAYDGGTMYVRRDTVFEQGWTGQTSRENGLEAILDLATMAIQDLQQLGSQYARLLGTSLINPVIPVPDAGRLLIARADEQGWENGPDAADIADAQENAAEAAASASSAASSAASVAASTAQITANQETGWLTNQKIITTTGVAPAYEITANDAIADIYNGQMFNILIHETNTGNATLNVTPSGGGSAFGPAAIRRVDPNNIIFLNEVPAGTLVAGSIITVVYDGSSFVQVFNNSADKNYSIFNLTVGTAWDWNNIIPGTQELNVDFDRVSLSGTDDLQIQLGVSGSVITENYRSSSSKTVDATSDGASDLTSYIIHVASTGSQISGSLKIRRVRKDSHVWVSSHKFSGSSLLTIEGSGIVTLAGEVDKVRLTRTGTNTFDNGTAYLSGK